MNYKLTEIEEKIRAKDPCGWDEAVTILRSSNDPLSLAMLGACYALGRGVKLDFLKGFALMENAWECGHPTDWNQLIFDQYVRLFSEGAFCPNFSTEHYAKLMEAVQAKYPNGDYDDCCHNLTVLCTNTDKTTEEIIKIYREADAKLPTGSDGLMNLQAAMRGNAAAMADMAGKYLSGFVVGGDTCKGLAWLMKAARSGLSDNDYDDFLRCFGMKTSMQLGFALCSSLYYGEEKNLDGFSTCLTSLNRYLCIDRNIKTKAADGVRMIWAVLKMASDQAKGYLRPAYPEDAEALAKLEADCFPAAEAASAGQIKRRIDTFGNHFIVLTRPIDANDEPAGSGSAEKKIGFINGAVTDRPDLSDEMYEDYSDHTESGAWQMIYGLNAAPDRRSEGIGAELVLAMINDANITGRKGLVLTCKERLIHYYERFGFVNEGVSSSTHGGATWYQMRLTLRV